MALFTFSDGTLDPGNYRGISVRSSSALTTGLVYTDWADVRLFEAIDWQIFLTAQGSITRLDMVIQYSTKLTPSGDTDFSTLQVESVDSSGIATLSDYDIRKTISSTVTLGITSPVRGRFMRLGIKAGVGSVTNSLCNIDVFRRKPRTV